MEAGALDAPRRVSGPTCAIASFSRG